MKIECPECHRLVAVRAYVKVGSDGAFGRVFRHDEIVDGQRVGRCIATGRSYWLSYDEIVGAA